MSMRIVLADDHRMVRDALRALLQEQEGMEVVGEAEDGRSAVALAAEVSPDVVVMDVNMPDLNGVEATRQIRAAYGEGELSRAPKVIALSAYGGRKQAAEMLNAGAAGYVVKIGAVAELSAALKAVLAGGVYLSPAISAGVVDEALPERGLLTGGKARNNGSRLSPREREVLQLIAGGGSTKEVARALNLSAKTIETHRKNIMEKLGIDSVAGLTRYAMEEGLTEVGG
jgi:DNA-binding NarL/FixJ family response regulator